MVREYVAYLRVEKGLRPASCEAYRRDLEQFAEHVEGRDGLLVGATQADVSGFMEGLRGHAVESRSIARKLSCLRGFYRWLLMDKRIEHDPTVNVETPASWKVLPKSLAEGEVAEMLERTGVGCSSGGCGWVGVAGSCDFGAAVCGWVEGGGDLCAAGGGSASGSGAGAGEREGR